MRLFRFPACAIESMGIALRPPCLELVDGRAGAIRLHPSHVPPLLRPKKERLRQYPPDSFGPRHDGIVRRGNVRVNGRQKRRVNADNDL